jgi:hypothetical protein
MAWIPGWDTVASAHWWENFYFWASIVALILLGVTEIISHRYTERKDELAAIEQDNTQRNHDEEMARLHLETSQADERAAKLENDAASLRLELAKLKTPRELTIEAQHRITDKLRNLPPLSFAFTIFPDPEPAGLMEQIASALKAAGWIRTAFPSRTGLSYTVPNEPNVGLLASFVGLQIEVPESKLTEWNPSAEIFAAALKAELPEVNARRDVAGTEATMDAVVIAIGKKP